MTPQLTTETTAIQLEEIKELYGPPPVLSTESVDAYYKIMARYLEELQPREFIETTFIPHLTNATWEIIRYNRYKSQMMESGFRKNAHAQGGKQEPPGRDPLWRALEAYRKASGRSEEKIKSDNSEKPKDVVDNAIVEVEVPQEKPANELDYVRALQNDFEYHERLDIWLSRAHVRLNAALEQFERYRDGLGQRLRGVSNEIIGVETQPKQLETFLVPLVEQQQ